MSRNFPSALQERKRGSEGIDPRIRKVDCRCPNRFTVEGAPLLTEKENGCCPVMRFTSIKKAQYKMLRYYGGEDLYYGIPCFDSMGPGRWSQKFRRHVH
jgi:hypothetical protein